MFGMEPKSLYQLKWTQGQRKDLQMIDLLISAEVRCYQWRIVRNLVCKARSYRCDRVSDKYRRKRQEFSPTDRIYWGFDYISISTDHHLGKRP